MSSSVALIDFCESLVQTHLMAIHVSFESLVDVVVDIERLESSAISKPGNVLSSESFQLIQAGVEIIDLCNPAIQVRWWSLWSLHSRPFNSEIVHLSSEDAHSV